MLGEDEVKEKVITVTSLDGSSKKLRMTNETTGQDLVSAFAEKIGLDDTSFFQLSEEMDGAGTPSKQASKHGGAGRR